MIFAFIVLVISTLNIVIAIYATSAIGSIVLSVIGLMEVLGWKLGTIESIAIVILIGFSVDYAVHLANHYVESIYDDRYRRIQEALAAIGISIFSGAITTIGSGFFLFFATIVFFSKFAVLITATIFFSLSYSICYFVCLIHVIGPQKKCGDLKYYIIDPCMKKFKQWIKNCRKPKEDANTGQADKNEEQEDSSL
eukprot:CAMPEP_0205812440 /NCGR_PEP_ID=MMETSP0205-20121125/16882_1 /ASSEMBLY_ACC=CAM_ASM_000278 /TAXON_ID=36767 /ORGANISM="Euplotes focardii, Strain TN1" /LENGTH=194 /DNA_ID=CAMNT_0053093097 /DNA_START=106 /DNA_END=687 /DNA_ORIENTATION=-